jgi:hypothetical protein
MVENEMFIYSFIPHENGSGWKKRCWESNPKNGGRNGENKGDKVGLNKPGRFNIKGKWEWPGSRMEGEVQSRGG